MHVWLSVAWMKSPGSRIFSRATLWQIPGDTPPTAEKSWTPVFLWKTRCISRRISIFGENGAILGTPSA
jgi:hypothetical protein